MSEYFVSPKDNHECKQLGNFITDEDRCDSVALPEKLNNIAKDCKEVAEKLKKKRTAKHEKDQESSSKQETVVQSSNTRIYEFQKTADILMYENNRLSEEIDKKPKDNTSGRDEEEKLSSLKAEILKLRQVCKEITEINKRWQKYNKEVHSYIQRLEDALQNKNTKSVSAALSTSQQYKDGNMELTEKEIPNLTRYDNLVKDTFQLQKKLETSKQTEEILREQLQQLGSESHETIKLLNFQLSIYKEDYEAEKREKIIARTTSMKLSKELEHVRSQLKECQNRLSQVEKFSRTPSAKSPDMPMNPFVSNLIEREAHSSRRNGCLRSDGPSDIQNTSDASKSIDDSKDDEHSEKCDSYECPDCGKTFPNEKQKEYLEHYEECQRN